MRYHPSRRFGVLGATGKISLNAIFELLAPKGRPKRPQAVPGRTWDAKSAFHRTPKVGQKGSETAPVGTVGVINIKLCLVFLPFFPTPMSGRANKPQGAVQT